VRLPYDKQQVKDAPTAEADGELSPEEEASLYRHYGLNYSEARSDSGLPQGQGRDAVGHDTSGPTTDDAMTRYEEELRVGKAQRESGRARLRKYVVTEQVQKTVPVQREEVRVEREPITDANVGDARPVRPPPRKSTRSPSTRRRS
jgi:stress response protein YsnF